MSPTAPRIQDSVAPPLILAERTWQTIDEEAEGTSDPQLSAGTVLGGRYRVDDPIGAGGMGRVYSGEHLGLQRPVAIKILDISQGAAETAVHRFAAEGRAAAALTHPGIVDVLDSGELADGRLYLVMERVYGRPLDSLLQERGRLPWREACALAADLASALAAAHRRGLIHRDLKPSNIMLTGSLSDPQRKPKILDFGIAADISRPAESRLTRPGQLLGTPLYMAPEQIDAGIATPQMDLYALGTILYQTISGHTPFPSDHPQTLLIRKRREAAPSLGTATENPLPRRLIAVVDACLDRDPLARPPSAALVERELRELLDPPLASDPLSPAPPVPPKGRSRSSRSSRIDYAAVLPIVTYTALAAFTAVNALLAAERSGSETRTGPR